MLVCATPAPAPCTHSRPACPQGISGKLARRRKHHVAAGVRSAHFLLPSCYARALSGLPPSSQLYNASLCHSGGPVQSFSGVGGAGDALGLGGGRRGGGGGGKTAFGAGLAGGFGGDYASREEEGATEGVEVVGPASWVARGKWRGMSRQHVRVARVRARARVCQYRSRAHTPRPVLRRPRA